MDLDGFFPGYTRAVRSLKRAFVNGRGTPFFLSGQGPIYSTVTATSLLALDAIGELSDSERLQYQRTLLNSRRARINTGDIGTRPEDIFAWDAQEGPSIWNTSLAVWALARTGYRGVEVAQGLEWMSNKLNLDQARQSQVGNLNLFVAGCLVQAIYAARLQQTYAGTITAITHMVRDSAHAFDGIYGWAHPSYTAQADPTCTLCALWILQNAGESGQDEDLMRGGVQQLRGLLRNHPGLWDMTIAHTHAPEVGLNPQVITSFTPSFIIPLLRLGIDPFDRLVLDPIRWLRQRLIMPGNENLPTGWSSIAHGDAPLAFPTAYALWGIYNWSRAVTRAARRETEHTVAPAVFIAHGRDGQHVIGELRNLLQAWGVQHIIVLRDEVDNLSSIFARVNQAARQCDYAIIVLAAEDVGGLHEQHVELAPRARQNVILELGLFLGLLGHERISALRTGEIEKPSDIDGVRFIDKEKADWAERLHRALRAAGIIAR